MNDLAKGIRAGYPRVWAALVEAHGPCAPEFEEGNQSWLMAAVADLFGDYSWDSIEAGLLRADEVLAERDRLGPTPDPVLPCNNGEK